MRWKSSYLPEQKPCLIIHLTVSQVDTYRGRAKGSLFSTVFNLIYLCHLSLFHHIREWPRKGILVAACREEQYDDIHLAEHDHGGIEMPPISWEEVCWLVMWLGGGFFQLELITTKHNQLGWESWFKAIIKSRLQIRAGVGKELDGAGRK